MCQNAFYNFLIVRVIPLWYTAKRGKVTWAHADVVTLIPFKMEISIAFLLLLIVCNVLKSLTFSCLRNINPLFHCFLSEMWYWVFLWALFSSLFVHGAVGVLMFVMLQRHRQGRLISVIVVSIGFLGSITGAMITSKSVFCFVLFLSFLFYI